MLVVDITHWLDEEGDIPAEHPHLRPQVLRIARLIEYAADLAPGWSRATLVECKKRPGRKPCPGLLDVVKTSDGHIYAFCAECCADEALVSNWQGTRWAKGLSEPLPPPE